MDLTLTIPSNQTVLADIHSTLVQDTDDYQLMKGAAIMLKENLKHAQETKKLVSIYMDSEKTNSFSVGYILNIEDDKLIIAHISPEGFYDGYSGTFISNIFRMDTESQYINKIFQLFHLHANPSFYPFNENQETDCFLKLIDFAKKNKLVVSIETYDSGYDDIQGYINSYSPDSISISLLNEFGGENGFSVVNLDAVSEITCDSSTEVTLKLLHQNQKK